MQKNQNQQTKQWKQPNNFVTNKQKEESQKNQNSENVFQVQKSTILNSLHSPFSNLQNEAHSVSCENHLAQTYNCKDCGAIFQRLSQSSTETCQKCCKQKSKLNKFKHQLLINGQQKQRKEVQTAKMANAANFQSFQNLQKQNNEYGIRVPVWEAFKKLYPEYCNEGVIVFPIQDILFDEYTDNIPTYCLAPKIIDLKPLPEYFSSLLEIWNTLQTFPEYFWNLEQKITFVALQKLLMDDEQFLAFISKIFEIFVNEFTSEKNDLLKKSKYVDLFGLIKFSSENLFLEKVYKRCWAHLSLTLLELFNEKNTRAQNSQIIELLKQLSQKCVHNCPKNITLRCKIVGFLTQLLTEASQFRRMITEKADGQKKSHKKGIELQERRRKLNKQIGKVTDQEFQMLKQQKNIKKRKIAQKNNNEKLSSLQNDLMEQVQVIRTKKAQLHLKLSEIEDQIRQEEDSKIKLTHVEYIGLDKNRSIYWNIITFPNKIFVSSQGNWSFFEGENINALLGSLNLRGVRQNNLYKALVNLINTQNFKKGDGQLQFQDFAQVISDESNNNQKIVSPIENLKNLLLESEKKITAYLDERNSRWGNQIERENFINFIEQIENFSISAILQVLRNFNEKICVVETEYKRIDEQSAEQIDTKTRKVQTKIWGISEKYKFHWTQYSLKVESFSELYFLVYILNLNVDKYTSKNRKKRKQFQLIKETSRYFKTSSCRKDQLAWQQSCQTCREGGELLCCDMCPKVYHLNCLEMTSLPEDKFQCEDCNNTRNIRRNLRKNKQ